MSFLSAEPLLIERLQARVDGVRKVVAVGELAELAKGGEALPALFVLPAALTLKSTDASKSKARYEEEWLVVLMVKSARQSAAGVEAQRAQAGPLLLQVFQALAGWAPATHLSALEPVTPPAPAMEGVFAYFPLAFRTAFHVTTAA